MLLIGSHAMATRIPIGRVPADIDIVCTYEEFEKFSKSLSNKKAQYPIQDGKKFVIKTDKTIVEAEIAWPDSIAEKLLILGRKDAILAPTEHGIFLIPSLNFLYMLKMSHRYLKNSPHFLKTMRDIQLMRRLGAKIEDKHLEFFKEREKATYDYGHPKLNVSKGQFFTDDVPYKYNHDHIHEAVKHLERPAYTYFMKDGKEVLTDKEKFFKLPHYVQLLAGLEEAYVLALERAIIPHGKMTAKESFDMALMKICSSITSGWFREFCYENYDAIQEFYNEGFVEKFWKAEKEGKVGLFKGVKDDYKMA